LIFTTNGFGNILGNFLTNISCHPSCHAVEMSCGYFIIPYVSKKWRHFIMTIQPRNFNQIPNPGTNGVIRTYYFQTRSKSYDHRRCKNLPRNKLHSAISELKVFPPF
jgi:hypothetical protein